MARTTGSLLLRIAVITLVIGGTFFALDYFLVPKGKEGGASGLTREQAEQIGRDEGTQIGREIGTRIGREVAAEMLAQRAASQPTATAPASEEPATEVVSTTTSEPAPPPAPAAPPPAEPAPVAAAPEPTPPPAPAEPAPAPTPPPAPAATPAPSTAASEPAAPPAVQKFPRNASVKRESGSPTWWDRSLSKESDALVLRYAGQLTTPDKASNGIALLFSGRFDKSVNFGGISVSGPGGPAAGEWQLGAGPGVMYLPGLPDGTYTVTISAGFKDADGKTLKTEVSGPVTVTRN